MLPAKTPELAYPVSIAEDGTRRAVTIDLAEQNSHWHCVTVSFLSRRVMRTVLYFRIHDAVLARIVQAKLTALPLSPVQVKGPRFVQRDDNPVEGLKDADRQQTTYRGELEVIGTFAGIVLATFAIAYVGTAMHSVPPLPACVAAAVAGGLIGWCAGRGVGGRLHRGLIARRRKMLAPGEMLMVVSCTHGTKDSVKLLVGDLGGESIGEHNKVLPDFRWA
jgi:hypothetical protein|uniref:hypothetical protein n=2 Tax=Cupriavidus TaxID=106589 RepID=UPI0031580784